MTKKNDVTEEEGKRPPLFFKRLIPLSADIHKDLKINRDINYNFAAKTASVPITMPELPIAVKHFPIIFAGDGSGIMLAALGIKEDENLFVDDEGRWLEGAYIPAYVRQFPFIVARQTRESEAIVCFDDSSPILSPEGDIRLFNDRKMTDELSRIVEFTRTFRHNMEASLDYGKTVESMGLIEDQGLSFKQNDEVKANINCLRAINRSKFDELDGDILKDWLNKGWIDTTVLHLASGSNFELLWNLHQKRHG